jgi:hypothetical protein
VNAVMNLRVLAVWSWEVSCLTTWHGSLSAGCLLTLVQCQVINILAQIPNELKRCWTFRLYCQC